MKKTIILLGLVTFAVFLSASNVRAQDASVQTTHRPLHVVGPCQFQIANMFGGNFDVSREHNDSVPQQGIYYFPDVGPKAPHVLSSFSLNCWSSRDTDVDAALGAKRTNDQWMRYGPSLDGPDLTPFEKGAHPQTVTLKGENWTGIGLTVDATTGDKEKRPRVFSFCLIHETQALCGSVPVVWLADPKHNDLWMVKSILQSVVFSDPPAPVSASETKKK